MSGHIEDVVVDEAYRGRHRSRTHASAHARPQHQIERIDLCSEPERESASASTARSFHGPRYQPLPSDAVKQQAVFIFSQPPKRRHG